MKTSILPDEEVFTLLGRDAAAPETIVYWIKKSLTSQPSDKLHAALDKAIEMQKQHEEIARRKALKEEKDKNLMDFNGDNI